MGRKILVTGGLLRENGYDLGEGKYYGCAKLLAIDTESGHCEQLISVDVGNENFPETHPNLEFTAGDVEGDLLWLPTDTEVRLYRYPSLDLLRTYSHPCFHNIHSVVVRGNELYVTSTGLDLVVVLDKRDGGIRNIVSAEGKAPWYRFSPDIDYRKVHSTRPHNCHPNYVFWIEDQPWVTRCTQEDAVKLGDPSIVIDISGSRRPISVHDGIFRDGKIYFTTVDGCIMIADASRRRVVEQVDLTSIKGFSGLRGWCRGLHIDDDTCYVAFSRLRRTKRAERLHWVNRMLMAGPVIEECSVLAVDINRRRIIGEFRLPAGAIDAIYSVLGEPDRGKGAFVSSESDYTHISPGTG